MPSGSPEALDAVEEAELAEAIRRSLVISASPRRARPTAPQAQGGGQAPLVLQQPVPPQTWELVPAEPVQVPAKPSSFVEAYRFYAVWHLPGRPEVTGVLAAREPDAWDRVKLLLPGEVYQARDGTRLRRFGGLQAAIDGYNAERDKHGCPPVRAWRL